MKKDPYQEWLAEKRQLQAPANFADNVMAALVTERLVRKTAGSWAKAALFALAVFGGLGRYAIAAFFVLFG